MRFSPALKLAACSARREPFVVIAMSSRLAAPRARATISTMSRRSSGSPPVSRIFFTPSWRTRCDALDLAGREPMRARQELVVLAEELGGHAIGATVIAAIDDRNPQVAQRPA